MVFDDALGIAITAEFFTSIPNTIRHISLRVLRAYLSFILLTKGLYQPIFHIRQDMSVSDKLTMTKLLPNGWIDFTQVVIKNSG
ncbi:hypothetical protein CW749_10100 [Vibrio sp. vnigr-6D03]|nr:hypothetical protein CW749_10100 [Vibrio sp. vnigr-6D03]